MKTEVLAVDETEPILLFHYTDLDGYNAIRSQVDWVFKAGRQRRKGRRDVRPPGAYFTTLPPDTPEISDRTRIPAIKREYLFVFRSAGDLQPLRGGRGRYVLFSGKDYNVEVERQVWCGPVNEYGSEPK